MALIKKLSRFILERESKHSEAECTYSIVVDSRGEKFLQLNTYGSAHRKMSGKLSQTIRFSPEAIAQLREILRNEL